ncbi:MAG: hypothetical protein PF517_19130 [Salinivirgaceae bacterium]|jgi:hypothetical protein|nr:hypothetical protein [Salinivirgaceae bacterium]
MRIIQIPLIIVIGLIFVQCDKNSEVQTEFYNFSTELNVEYNSDTISIGDTLWFESEIQGFLKDSASKSNIHFRAASINLNMVVRSWNIVNQKKQPSHYDFVFKSAVDHMTFTDKATILGLYYIEYESVYTLRFGIVFNSPGVYSIDSDYLRMKNYFSNNIEYLGGGLVEMNDMNDDYQAGSLKSDMVVENRNLHLYSDLSDEDRNSFHEVNSENELKYFFIKVNE